MFGENGVIHELRPADVFFTHGTSVVSRLIRFFTRGAGESRTRVNHVGVVVGGGSYHEAIVVEALSTVRRHRLWGRYGPPKRDLVAIYRPVDLSPQETAQVVAGAMRYVGRKYGWFMLIAHLLDWTLQGVYLFRRLAGIDRYPICSWVVAHAFLKAGRDFGVPAGAADPDDIWDYVVAHPDRYVRVHPLARLRNEPALTASAAPDERAGTAPARSAGGAA